MNSGDGGIAEADVPPFEATPTMINMTPRIDMNTDVARYA
jgi:hypothetical protein